MEPVKQEVKQSMGKRVLVGTLMLLPRALKLVGKLLWKLMKKHPIPSAVVGLCLSGGIVLSYLLGPIFDVLVIVLAVAIVFFMVRKWREDEDPEEKAATEAKAEMVEKMLDL
jgi:chromate transport protein ChrA